MLQLVSSETTTASRSRKVTFKHCPKLKDAYTGPSEMLELISSACIQNSVRHHTELFEKSNKIKEGKTHSKPATKMFENLCIAFCEERGEKLFWRKVQCPNFVYLFATPVFNLSFR